MKKLWTIAILFNVVFAQLPQPTIVGQDDLQIPTLSINNFVNEAEIVGLEDTRVFLGITNILTENVMDSRYDLVEQDSDFEMTARVIYLGRPRKSTTFLGLFRSSTGFQINEELPFDRSELGGALKEAIGNAVKEIL